MRLQGAGFSHGSVVPPVLRICCSVSSGASKGSHSVIRTGDSLLYSSAAKPENFASRSRCWSCRSITELSWIEVTPYFALPQQLLKKAGAQEQRMRRDVRRDKSIADISSSSPVGSPFSGRARCGRREGRAFRGDARNLKRARIDDGDMAIDTFRENRIFGGDRIEIFARGEGFARPQRVVPATSNDPFARLVETQCNANALLEVGERLVATRFTSFLP